MAKAEPPNSYGGVSRFRGSRREMSRRTAKDPGAFLAAVHPAPRYSPIPSSATILKTPRPLNASGFVCRLIFRTSKGSRIISPMPMILMHRVSATRADWDNISVIPSSCRVHYCLSRTLAECIVEFAPVMKCQIISHERLSSILVYPLQDLRAEHQQAQ